MSTATHKLLKGTTGDWEMVIGMEIHAQVTSNSKLFSGASTAFGGEPNSHVSLVDAAMPGMLPVINEECVRQAGQVAAKDSLDAEWQRIAAKLLEAGRT